MGDIKIALLGGTFDPVHNAHVLLAEQMYAKINPDKFLIMPAGVPYYKNRTDITDDVHRLNMCRLAFDDRFEVSDIEIKRAGPTYTIDTLEYLHSAFENAVIYFVCGADMFLTLRNWNRYPDIIKLAVICAAPRHGIEAARMGEYAAGIENDGGCVIISDKFLPDISSTNIRRMLETDVNVSEFLPGRVYEYIKKNGIYKTIN